MRSADIQAGNPHGKRLFRKLFRDLSAAGLSAVFFFGVLLLAAQVGATADRLEAAGVVYESVKVVSVSSTTVTIRHRGGLAQLPLRTLPPEWQQRLGYTPADAAVAEFLQAAEARQRESAVARPPPPPPARRAVSVHEDTPVGRAMARFGTPAPLVGVDLRPRYRELELGLKNQGLRPSCAVFAVVSALEYQNAAVGPRERLSEEYLIWATRRTLGLQAGEKRRPEGADADDDDRDAGFTLQEVLAALRAYGIPRQSEMPNRFGLGMEKIADPSDEVIATARTRRQVATYSVPGVNNAVRLGNILHALNEGLPVVIALRWPHWRTLQRAPVLAGQPPREGRAHAVTLVGYASEGGGPPRFIFKNSWGIRWGAGGYGYAEYEYLQRNLLDAVVLEVRPGAG